MENYKGTILEEYIYAHCKSQSFVEKSGAAHNELSKKLFDLSSEIRTYADKDLKDRRAPHKKLFHQTADTTDRIQNISQPWSPVGLIQILFSLLGFPVVLESIEASE